VIAAMVELALALWALCAPLLLAGWALRMARLFIAGTAKVDGDAGTE
jgi:hypothetical protein